MDVVIRKIALEMEGYRRSAKQQWGDKYETRVGSYRSLIVKEMRQRGCSAAEAGFTFIGLLKPRGKLTEPVKAAIMAAALDVVEMKLGESHPKPREVNLPVTVPGDDDA